MKVVSQPPFFRGKMLVLGRVSYKMAGIAHRVFTPKMDGGKTVYMTEFMVPLGINLSVQGVQRIQ